MEKNKEKYNKYITEYIKENKEKRRECSKKHYEENKEEIRIKFKKYYEENKEKYRKNGKRWRENNKEYIKEYSKEYEEKHKERIAKRKKEYRSRPEVRERMRKNYKKYDEKRWKDPIYRFNNNMSRSIRLSLKKNNLSKNGNHWEDLVGYTSQELRDHLESLFQPGMTWGNRGKWHIDHIIPQSFFQIKSIGDVEFRMCWRLENLQPLWAVDNIRKKDKIQRGKIW